MYCHEKVYHFEKYLNPQNKNNWTSLKYLFPPLGFILKASYNV